MRCIVCDKKLNDYESTRRHGMTYEFLDMCNRCVKDIPNLPTKDRPDLVKFAEVGDDLDSLGNDLDLDTVSGSVTHCYNLALDKERE